MFRVPFDYCIVKRTDALVVLGHETKNSNYLRQLIVQKYLITSPRILPGIARLITDTEREVLKTCVNTKIAKSKQELYGAQ